MVKEEVVKFRVEFGRRMMPMAEVRRLAVGEVVNLDTKVSAVSPLTLYADGRLIGYGEAVVIGDSYGVRIIDIVPAEDR